jgi:hypothetical protein
MDTKELKDDEIYIIPGVKQDFYFSGYNIKHWDDFPEAEVIQVVKEEANANT